MEYVQHIHIIHPHNRIQNAKIDTQAPEQKIVIITHECKFFSFSHENRTQQ